MSKRNSFHGTFKFFNLSFVFQSNSFEVLEFFKRLYGYFLLIGGKDSDHHESSFLIERDPSTGNLTLRCNQEDPITIPNSPNAFQLVDSIIFNHIVTRVKTHFLIHALSLSFEEEGLILSGPTGVGKTTLGLELIQRGFRFLSDELAAITRGPHLVDPFPRALNVRKKTLKLFNNLDLSTLGSTLPLDDQRYLINVEKVSGGVIGTTCKARFLIFLSTRPDSKGGMVNESSIVVVLKKKDDKLIADLRGIPGVKYLSSYTKDGTNYPRFLVKKDRLVQKKFVDLCEKNKDSVVSRVRAVDRTPDSGTQPKIFPISKSEAALALFSNLQNLNFDGLNTFKSPLGTPPRIIAELSSVVAGMDCYRLVVGDLVKTADIVCQLVQKKSPSDLVGVPDR